MKRHCFTPFYKKRYNAKVFCIGFNKTGTTSFGAAMRQLGFRHASFSQQIWGLYKSNDIVDILQYTAKFESLDDLPWLKDDMIPVLDRVFPGSKFVYLERDEQSWMKSMNSWWYKIFGEYPDLDAKLEEYRAHREFVYDYFKGRSSESFIVLDVRDPEGYTKLGEFLGVPVPSASIPHLNKTSKLR